MRGRNRPYRSNYQWIGMVGAEGFEPPTLCSQSRCATRLRYAPTVCLDCTVIGLAARSMGYTRPAPESAKATAP